MLQLKVVRWVIMVETYSDSWDPVVVASLTTTGAFSTTVFLLERWVAPLTLVASSGRLVNSCMHTMKIATMATQKLLDMYHDLLHSLASLRCILAHILWLEETVIALHLQGLLLTGVDLASMKPTEAREARARTLQACTLH